MTVQDLLKTPVRQIVELLVAGRFDEVAELTQRERLSVSEMRMAIRDYGQQLIVPPESAFDRLDIVEVGGAQPSRWSVRFDLWTKEEGKSDLSLGLTLIEHGSGFKIELDDIHVL